MNENERLTVMRDAMEEIRENAQYYSNPIVAVIAETALRREHELRVAEESRERERHTAMMDVFNRLGAMSGDEFQAGLDKYRQVEP